jgi:hypothetical protein
MSIERKDCLIADEEKTKSPFGERIIDSSVKNEYRKRLLLRYMMLEEE